MSGDNGVLQQRGDSGSTQQTVAVMVATWLKGQPFNNVMIVCLVAIMGYLGRVIIYDLIPGERQAIESLVDRVEDRQTQQIDRVCESFERALDRERFRYTPGGSAGVGSGVFGSSSASVSNDSKVDQ